MRRTQITRTGAGPRQCSKRQNHALPAARGHGFQSKALAAERNKETKKKRERRVHQSRPRASEPVLQSRPRSRGNARIAPRALAERGGREMAVATRPGIGRRSERRTLRTGDRRRRGEGKPYGAPGAGAGAGDGAGWGFPRRCVSCDRGEECALWYCRISTAALCFLVSPCFGRPFALAGSHRSVSPSLLWAPLICIRRSH